MKKNIVYDRNRFPVSYVQYNTFAACCPLLLYGISVNLYGVFCAKMKRGDVLRFWVRYNGQGYGRVETLPYIKRFSKLVGERL